MKQNKRTSSAQSATKNIYHGLKCSICHELIHKKCSYAKPKRNIKIEKSK